MSFALHLHLKVKFRAFGITFGTVEEVFSVSYDGTFHVIQGGSAPSQTTVLFNQRGVLLEAWL